MSRWRSTKVKYACHEVDVRHGEGDLPLLSVSIHRGVIPRSEITDRVSRADDTSEYKRCQPNDIVLNRMRAFQGAIGISQTRGLVTPEYLVLRAELAVQPRFLSYLFKSSWFVSEMSSRVQGIGTIEQGNMRTPRIYWDQLGAIQLKLPGQREQQTIADLLDRETARIDGLVERRSVVLRFLWSRWEAAVFHAVTKGLDTRTPLAPTRLEWAGDIPAHWTTPPVYANYEVQLGRMLNPERAIGPSPAPYLRNTNVQWDRLDLDDLPTMSFDGADRLKYALRPGDLLVCEGGEVGRAAIWGRELDECYYQKAVHRVRPWGDNNARFLMYCLWAAASIGVFNVEGNQATIVHLTAEKLREHRFPMPPRPEQDIIVAHLDERQRLLRSLTERIERQIDLLREHRQALITAAVAGEHDPSDLAA